MKHKIFEGFKSLTYFIFSFVEAGHGPLESDDKESKAQCFKLAGIYKCRKSSSADVNCFYISNPVLWESHLLDLITSHFLRQFAELKGKTHVLSFPGPPIQTYISWEVLWEYTHFLGVCKISLIVFSRKY